MTEALTELEKRMAREAAELIEREGWHQGGLRDYDNHGRCIGRCLIAALIDSPTNVAANGEAWWGPEVDAVARAVHPELDHWNDEPERTKDEVVARLYEVAAA